MNILFIVVITLLIILALCAVGAYISVLKIERNLKNLILEYDEGDSGGFD
jgi:uncharacterized protein YneF (UPF0154 family)